MGEAAKRIATYTDIEALPPGLVGEIIDGELHTMPRPPPNNLNAQSCLLSWTNSRFQMGNGGPGGWWIMVEPELHLGSDVLVPDIAGWRRERMPRLPRSTFLSLVPDWICEVLSPSTASYDRVKKHWIWIAAHADDERVRVAPFEEAELGLSDLWAVIEDLA